MKYTFFIFILVTSTVISCAQGSQQKPSNKNNQGQRVGGGCEGCEAIYESPVPFEQLNSVDTLPDFNEPGPKIEVSGIVYQSDGRTPAKDVVIYVYHTDQTGHYTQKGNEKGWGKRHGYIRGWMKTDKNGYYQFYTLRPAAYPNRRDPAHIHVTVKEPDKNEYWIDEYLFADDPLLTEEEKNKQEKRGGNGILELVPEKGRAHGTRHIILGANVPDYPSANLDKNLKSGLSLGSNCPAFDPLHLSGADSGKKTCPMCKYGYGQGIMLWFNHANLDQLQDFAKTLENEMKQRGEKNLRVFLVYMNPFYKKDQQGQEILGRKIRLWCQKQGLKKVAMVWVPSPVDPKTCGLYKINPDAKNTVFVYKKRIVIDKLVNIEYDGHEVKEILKQIDAGTL